MKVLAFIKHLKEYVIDNEIYRNLLDSTSIASDHVWQGILPIYKELNKELQDSFLQFLRLIQVNTLSNLLGILDGSTFLSSENEKFILRTEGSDTTINGDLQDIFLGLEENY